MARLPYVDPANAPPTVAEVLRSLPDLRLFAMIGHAETALVPWLSMGGALLSSLSLDPVLRELAILQVAVSTGSDYERVQHETIAAGVGAPPQAVAAVIDGQLDSAALSGYAGVLRVVDELVATHTTSDTGMNLMHTELGVRGSVELLLVVGFYLALALLAAAVELDPDRPAQMAAIDTAGHQEAS
jgi:alkylhydroperoxidase family enzyme